MTKRKFAITFDKKKGRTKQAFKDDCDINKIVGRYKTTGVIPVTTQTRRYGHQPEETFHQVQQKIADAKTMFEQLPLAAKDKFETVGNFIDALTDPERLQEIVESGIIADMDDIPIVSPERPAESPTESPQPDPVEDQNPAPESIET